jgi:hypothetical protein
MAKVGRNEPCPCRSGRKTKRCCGQESGPSPEALATAELHGWRAAGAVQLVDHDGWELRSLFAAAVNLPVEFSEAVVDLPRPLPPAVVELRAALELMPDWPANVPLTRMPLDDGLVVRASAEFGALARVGLARAVLGLNDAGQVSSCCAAAAVVDLAEDDSLLLQVSVVQALRVDLGHAARASGTGMPAAVA